MGRSGRGSLGEDRAVSATVGYVLIVIITVVGVGAVVAFGATALDQTKQTASIANTEQVMTQFDAQTAIVALGASDVQTVELTGGGSGTYDVDSDSGWIRVRHLNYTGNGDNETIYNASMGSVTYEQDGVEIAYQGGGVWRTEDNGTVMVSPPEFHYRDATLTLPAIDVTGSGGATGATTAVVSSVVEARRVFPNLTTGLPNGTGPPYDVKSLPYRNPVENGTVTVTVHSEHFRGWATYFRDRTEGDVTVEPGHDLVHLELEAIRIAGHIPPTEGSTLRLSGVPKDHGVRNFTLLLRPDKGSDFSNLHWSLYSDTPTQDLEIHVHAPDKCTGSPSTYGGTLDVSVYYHESGMSGYHGWQNRSIDPTETAAASVNCAAETLRLNFTGDVPLNYTAIEGVSGGAGGGGGGGTKWYFGPEIESSHVRSPAKLTSHPSHADGDAGVNNTVVADAGDRRSLGFLLEHYLAVTGPNVRLGVRDGSGKSGRIDEGDSSGAIEYRAEGSQYITYLHVTKNVVRVRLR